MSAAATRRRKQLAAKAAMAASTQITNMNIQDDASTLSDTALFNNSTSSFLQPTTDPVTLRLQTLLLHTPVVDEATAYEALQLAQSQLRRFVKLGEYEKATVSYGYDIALLFLERHTKPSVASQLLNALLQALKETHTPCTKEWIERILHIDTAFITAVLKQKEMPLVPPEEIARLMRLHFHFLKGALRWSEALGSVRYGAMEIHELEGIHAWRLASFLDETVGGGADTPLEESQKKPEGTVVGGTNQTKKKNKKIEESKKGLVEEEEDDLEEEEDDENHIDQSPLALRHDAVTHLALAEKPDTILQYLATLPGPTEEQTKTGHTCAACLREALLTRSILLMIAVENLRDAHSLLTKYLDTVETRNIQDLKVSYMNKSDGKAPSYPIFLSMLLSIIAKADKKVGPLYTWLLKTFSSELDSCYKNKTIQTYLGNIGKLYFDIVPPPSMLNTLESMMAMMGGGGGGGRGGGGPAGGFGGMNPALMQAMMQQMQGGGF